jgi:hypothetical protein
MRELHYGVIQADGHWKVIGRGLKSAPFESFDAAEAAVRRMAAESTGLGLDVVLHVQDDIGELRRTVTTPIEQGEATSPDDLPPSA